ncbi:MAG: DUF1080 domain-containing protein [Kiritimatiellae bacterium]|nr:DUF1080 domain-containing protein [Kiritimatiellia bacterium]
MTSIRCGAMTVLCLVGLQGLFAGEPNQLTPEEQAQGWRLLFDGRSLDAWKSLHKPEIPPGWVVTNGTLTILKSSKAGDLITKERFSNFEFCFEFRLTPGANSGVKYLIDPSRAQGGHGVGPEYQVLDDQRHPDAKLRADGSRTTAALYDVLPAAKDKPLRPPGEWNEGRIVVKGRHVEHWLNGVKVLEYERGSEAFRAAVAKSKFSKMADFAEWADGHLLLQDHNDEVSYRNLKIRVLSPE